MVLNDDIEHHWGMYFKDDNGRVEGKKALHHVKRCNVYNPDTEDLINGGYSVEVTEK